MLGDLIQWIYGEDSMDGAFIAIEAFGLSNREFEHNYRVEWLILREVSFLGCLRLVLTIARSN